jgi:isopentenyl diphosphate isomerase/L-lactate dehydrogenase-like FMN-dependent dehydrogenase
VLRTVALGAKSGAFGKAWGLALAAAGERGVTRRTVAIRGELHTPMVLTGCADAREATGVEVRWSGNG